MNIKLISALAATALLSAAPAFAAPVTFDFETVTSGLPVDAVHADYDFTFGGDLLGVVNDPSITFFTKPTSALGVISSVGPDNALNIVSPDASFTGDLTFSYSATTAASVTVWSGLNGTGSSQTFNLAANSGNCAEETPFCVWQSATFAFTGFAKSITFDTQYFAAFDDVTVNAVPLPAAGWLLMTALTGFGALRRKRAAA